MKIRANAKVNLALDVVRKREDGYHELHMIMAPITLHDLIIIEPIREGISLTTNVPHIPVDERNIMYKAAQLMKERYEIKQGVRMHCYKHIPTQAGLGGGSADGAAVMRAMNKIFHLHISYEELAQEGKSIGADIPFCIYNKTAVVQGIGEQLTFLENNLQPLLLLVKPRRGVSTKRCFETLSIEGSRHPDIDGMKDAILNQDYEGLVAKLGNSLEAPSLAMVKEIATIKEEMLAFGLDGALMSGSGSCVFGLTNDPEILQRAFVYFRGKYSFVRKSQILR
ncbi:MAG: 4-(cytidine 5'-diphospho)-2-C-methyl-D-erythritol kinase [bacterium]